MNYKQGNHPFLKSQNVALTIREILLQHYEFAPVNTRTSIATIDSAFFLRTKSNTMDKVLWGKSTCLIYNYKCPQNLVKNQPRLGSASKALCAKRSLTPMLNCY